jgi:hypothetical protein
MIRLLFVGDGPRDTAIMPAIVSTILAKQVRPDQLEPRVWARLHDAGRGYDRKLLFALAQARADGLAGVVATVDSDKSGSERLDKMRTARATDRARNPPIPIALGCADPHGEAWLLDDPDAIRAGLNLPVDHVVTSVRKTKNPKSVLEAIMSSKAGARPLELMETIALALVPSRCTHKMETGFEAFEREVKVELADCLTLSIAL